MIRLNHADKYYNRGGNNELHVMDDVTLELPDSGMIAIYGQSGCGKTTFLNAIGGLDRIGSGEISVFGEDISKRTDEIRNKYIGYIFQNYNLSKNETVFENVAAALRLCGMDKMNEIQERVIAALTNVGMEKFKNRLPDTLSGGQQQRVAIARALVKNPAIILADEPTGNLDEENTILVMNILKQVSRDHLVLLVTHEAHLVDFYCDRVIEIVDGRVNSIRDNENANGYSGKNKNDIYLGELEKKESELPGVTIEYYGEAQEKIKLRIVSIAGRLYLKSDSPRLVILDDSSEVKLREGNFEEKKAFSAEGDDARKRIDMSHLTPIECKKTGRLFSFRSALVSGYRENFSKNRKRGNKLLRLSMFLLACVVVFMSANFAVCIKNYSNVKENHDEHLFYLPLTEQTDTTPISSHMGENGIDYARINGSDSDFNSRITTFRAGAFITAKLPSIIAVDFVMDSRLSEGLPLVAGTRNFENPTDVLVTTAWADDMIENSGIQYLKDYSDILNMVSNSVDALGNRVKIIGVVESDEPCYFMQSVYATYTVLHKKYINNLPLLPATMDPTYSGKVDEGTVIFRTDEMTESLNRGDQVVIMGDTYTISEINRSYNNADAKSYEKFVAEIYGESLITKAEYIADALQEDSTANTTKIGFEWFYDYYIEYMRDFLSHVSSINTNEWLYMDSGMVEGLIASVLGMKIEGSVPVDLYIAHQYYKEKGTYPTDAEFDSYVGTKGKDSFAQQFENTLQSAAESNESAYNTYIRDYNRFFNSYASGNRFVLNDSDYIALAYTTGKNDKIVSENNLFTTHENYYDDGEEYYSQYLMIHASNPAEAKAYLSEHYGDTLITPEEVFDENLKSHRATIVADLISLCVVVGLICLCVFFIMRSSLMNRIKEIGIYRAIGVSKRNLTFRFMVESLVLITFSLTIGYVIVSAFMMKLSTAIFFSDIFYFPLWFSALLLLTLYGVSVLCGTIPVWMLLRRTPSEIISKYDI